MRAHEVGVPIGAEHEKRRLWCSAQGVQQELERRSIRPVQVVEDDHDGRLGGYGGDEAGHRLEKPVALCLGPEP